MPWIDEKTAHALSELIAKAYAQEKEKMSENINQFIHTTVLGLCWHKWREARSSMLSTEGWICEASGCQQLKYGEGGNPHTPQDGGSAYDTDLNECAKAEKAAIEKFGIGRYGDAVLRELDKPNLNIYIGGFSEKELGRVATAPADVRCLALKMLYENVGDGDGK